MSVEVGARHTPQEVREIVAWQRYQEQRAAAAAPDFSPGKTTPLRQQKRQVSLDNGQLEEAVYSNSDFHQAPGGRIFKYSEQGGGGN